MAEKIKIMQGDAYSIPFGMSDQNGETIRGEHVAEIEVTIGAGSDQPLVRKTMTDGGVTYDPSAEMFLVRLEQKDTFALAFREGKMKVRVHFAGTDDVCGEDVAEIEV